MCTRVRIKTLMHIKHSANFVTKSSFLIKKVIRMIADDLLISVGKYWKVKHFFDYNCIGVGNKNEIIHRQYKGLKK